MAARRTKSEDSHPEPVEDPFLGSYFVRLLRFHPISLGGLPEIIACSAREYRQPTINSREFLSFATLCSFVNRAPFPLGSFFTWKLFALLLSFSAFFLPTLQPFTIELDSCTPCAFFSRFIMAAAHPDAASGMEPNPGMNTSHQPGSTHTPQTTFPTPSTAISSRQWPHSPRPFCHTPARTPTP